jgi:hypothetical protein
LLIGLFFALHYSFEVEAASEINVQHENGSVMDEGENGSVMDEDLDDQPFYEFDPFHDDKIYDNSNISIKDFCIFFLSVINKIKTSNEANDLILSFLRSILPSINKLPPSYNSLISLLSIEKPVEKRICNICHEEFEKSKCMNKIRSAIIIIIKTKLIKKLKAS